MSVAPTWVELSRPRKVAHVLPAVIGFFYTSKAEQHESSLEILKTDPIDNGLGNQVSSILVDESIALKLSNVEFDIRSFLDLHTVPDEHGFYLYYESTYDDSFVSR